ncbi:MAG: hypothetical protein ABSH20_05955, partial [Tepidisphaeraceae bacterium]
RDHDREAVSPVLCGSYKRKRPHCRREKCNLESAAVEPRPKKTLIFTCCQRPKPLITTLQAGPYVSSPQNHQPPNIFFRTPSTTLNAGAIQTLRHCGSNGIAAFFFNPIHHHLNHNHFLDIPLCFAPAASPAPEHFLRRPQPRPAPGPSHSVLPVPSPTAPNAMALLNP